MSRPDCHSRGEGSSATISNLEEMGLAHLMDAKAPTSQLHITSDNSRVGELEERLGKSGDIFVASNFSLGLWTLAQVVTHSQFIRT